MQEVRGATFSNNLNRKISVKQSIHKQSDPFDFEEVLLIGFNEN